MVRVTKKHMSSKKKKYIKKSNRKLEKKNCNIYKSPVWIVGGIGMRSRVSVKTKVRVSYEKNEQKIHLAETNSI